MPRPLWRWALFCIAVDIHAVRGWRWALNLMRWAVLPEWLGDVGATCGERRPF